MFDTNIRIYGIIITIAVISGLIVVYKNLKKIDFKYEEKIALLLYMILGSVFGGKYYTFIINYNIYKGLFDFNKIGLSSFGALLGIIIMLFIFSKQFKKKILDLLYIIIPSVPLIYGIGKIGCFVSGCCHGIKYDGIFHIVYRYSYIAPKDVSLFPIQLLEAVIFIIIFIFIQLLYNRKKEKSIIIGLTFFSCGLSKFLLDFLRYKPEKQLITINQLFSIVFIIIGIIIIINNYNKIKKKKI